MYMVIYASKKIILNSLVDRSAYFNFNSHVFTSNSQCEASRQYHQNETLHFLKFLLNLESVKSKKIDKEV